MKKIDFGYGIFPVALAEKKVYFIIYYEVI